MSRIDESQSGLSLSVHSTIGDLESSEWDQLAGDNAFASYGWLLAAERCWLVTGEAVYFVARCDGEVAGGAVCYIVSDSRGLETLDELLLGRFTRIARCAGVGFLPALVCGPAQGYGWHIGVSEWLDIALQDRVRRIILNAMEKEADARGLVLSFALVLDNETALRTLLVGRCYLASRNMPVAVLDIPWNTFEAYLDHLPRRRRREFQRQHRRNHEAGTRIELLDAENNLDASFLALLDGNARNHGWAGFPFASGFLEILRAQPGAGTLQFIARKGETVTGALLVLVRKDTALAYAVGVDPHLARDDLTYFELVYRQLIEYAIGRGVKRIYYGRGMYELKKRRGCFLTESAIFTRVQYWRRPFYRAWYAISSLWLRYKLPVEAGHFIQRDSSGRLESDATK